MIKNAICVFAALLTIFTFTSCESESELSYTDAPEVISEYYTRRSVSSWQDAAAVFLSGTDRSKIKIEYPACDGGLMQEASCLLMHTLLGEKCGTDHVSACKKAVEKDFALYEIKEIATSAFALEVLKTGYEYADAANYIEKLQLKSGGYPIKGEYTAEDNSSSAYALELMLLWRDKISDDNFDNLVIYISNQFTDKNLISDGKKESASVSAEVLRALIHAGIPNDGQISLAMQKSFDVLFRVELGESLLGYKEYEDDETYTLSSSAEIMYTLAVTGFGDIFSAVRR